MYSGSTDPSMCNGAPVYQKGGGDGPVLYRVGGDYGSTLWKVSDSSALETCGATATTSSRRLASVVYSTGTNPSGGTGWIPYLSRLCGTSQVGYTCGIAIVAGGRYM